jgi:hypothetical protein
MSNTDILAKVKELFSKPMSFDDSYPLENNLIQMARREPSKALAIMREILTSKDFEPYRARAISFVTSSFDPFSVPDSFSQEIFDLITANATSKDAEVLYEVLEYLPCSQNEKAYRVIKCMHSEDETVNGNISRTREEIIQNLLEFENPPISAEIREEILRENPEWADY